MQWLDEAPDDWESAPEDPPSTGSTRIGAEPLQNGITIREEDADGAYIYAEEGEIPLQEYA